MSFKDKEKRKQYMKEYRERTHYDQNYYQANKQRHALNSSRYKRKLYDWYIEIKSQESCIICGENDPNKLHFHHRDPKTKVMSVSDMVNWKHAKQKILDEMAKCDIMCASCHIGFHSMFDKYDDDEDII